MSGYELVKVLDTLTTTRNLLEEHNWTRRAHWRNENYVKLERPTVAEASANSCSMCLLGAISLAHAEIYNTEKHIKLNDAYSKQIFNDDTIRQAFIKELRDRLGNTDIDAVVSENPEPLAVVRAIELWNDLVADNKQEVIEVIRSVINAVAGSTTLTVINNAGEVVLFEPLPSERLTRQELSKLACNKLEHDFYAVCDLGTSTYDAYVVVPEYLHGKLAETAYLNCWDSWGLYLGVEN